MRRRIQADTRFGKWPKARQYENRTIVSAKLLTSQRMFLLSKLVYKPSEIIWIFVVKLCVIELLCFLGGLGDVFGAMSCTRLQFYLFLVGVSLLWYWEKFKDYKLTRLMFGKRFIVKVYNDRVQLGGRLFKKTFHRNQRLMFSLESFTKAHDEVYQSSQRLCLIVGDAHRVELLEIFGPLDCTMMVNNLNTALRIHDPNDRIPAIAQIQHQRA